MDKNPTRAAGSVRAAKAAGVVASALLLASPLPAQVVSGVPRVVIPTSNRQLPTLRPAASPGPQFHPWRLNITATIFWIGEQPSQNNPTPNHKSSWDQKWAVNYGGYDDPNPAARVADHRAGEFRPKNFVPGLNPFYVALPYNDVQSWNRHKPEASRVIPWFKLINPDPGKTVLKGRWVQIYNGKLSCYAQWEDCGPWVTDDYEYVFLNKPPKNKSNKSAGIDISPAIRDYLGLQSGQKCHWRFVEASQVPHGPWKKYGTSQPQMLAQAFNPASVSPPPAGADLDAQQRYMEYLRKLRDEQYLKKTPQQIQSGG